jgi:hypothetical protein
MMQWDVLWMKKPAGKSWAEMVDSPRIQVALHDGWEPIGFTNEYVMLRRQVTKDTPPNPWRDVSKTIPFPT